MKITGKGPQKGGTEPVWTNFRHRAVKTARVVGPVFQAIYYGLKIWHYLG